MSANKYNSVKSKLLRKYPALFNSYHTRVAPVFSTWYLHQPTLLLLLLSSLCPHVRTHRYVERSQLYYFLLFLLLLKSYHHRASVLQAVMKRCAFLPNSVVESSTFFMIFLSNTRIIST